MYAVFIFIEDFFLFIPLEKGLRWVCKYIWHDPSKAQSWQTLDDGDPGSGADYSCLGIFLLASWMVSLFFCIFTCSLTIILLPSPEKWVRSSQASTYHSAWYIESTWCISDGRQRSSNRNNKMNKPIWEGGRMAKYKNSVGNSVVGHPGHSAAFEVGVKEVSS